MIVRPARPDRPDGGCGAGRAGGHPQRLPLAPLLAVGARRAVAAAAALLATGIGLAVSGCATATPSPTVGTVDGSGPLGGINVEPSMRPWRYDGPNPQSWWCVMPNCSADFANGTEGPLPTIRRELAQARSLGAAYVRLEFPWAVIEPEPGSFDWGRSDAIFQAAAQAGIAIQPLLMWTPPWAAGAPADPPDDASDWTTFVAAFTQRYDGRIPVVEIWNEPDDAAYFRGSELAYVDQLLDPAYTTIKEIDPSIGVMAAGSANDAGSCCTWLSGLLSQAARFDIVSFHNYAGNYLGEARSYRTLLDSHGRNATPIWMTEFGVQSSSGNQSAALQTVFGTPSSSSSIALADWYNLRDTDAWACCPPRAVVTASWGLLSAGFARKPSFSTMQRLIAGKGGPPPPRWSAPPAPVTPAQTPVPSRQGSGVAAASAPAG